MFAVVAKFRDSRMDLIGFGSTQEEIDRLIDSYISRYGAEALGDAGVQFNVELAT